MTAIVSLFGFVARFAGDLLNTATGWAGTLMFGRVPQSHRRYLTAMLGGSVLWVVLVIVFLVPGILAWSLSTTPHPSFITSSWLAFVATLGVVLVPLGVGLAAWMAPADENRAKGLRGALEPVRGYLLAPVIGGLLVFLAGVGFVRKVAERAAPLVRHAHPDRRSAGRLRRHGRHHPRRAGGCRVPARATARVAAAQPARLGAHPPRRAERPASPARIA